MVDARRAIKDWIYRIQGCVSERGEWREMATGGGRTDGTESVGRALLVPRTTEGSWLYVLGKQWVSGRCVIQCIIQDSMLRFGSFLVS